MPIFAPLIATWMPKDEFSTNSWNGFNPMGRVEGATVTPGIERMPSQMKPGSRIIRCQECGKESGPVEFIRGLNVCDHLFLDALALKMG